MLSRPNRVELSPLSFLERAGRAFAERVAVVEGERRFTYAELHARAHRLAAALQAAGVQPGERVAVLAPNGSALLEAHFGVPLSGAVLVAINTRLAPMEIGYILQHSAARVLIVDTELSALVQPVLADCTALETVVCVQASPVPAQVAGVEYEAFLPSGANLVLPPEPASEDDPISINYTSGTTGMPKGVVYTHRGAYLNALSVALALQLGPDSVYLWTLPMFHCNGWCYPWGATAAGATHVTLRRVDPALVWATIEQHNVTHFCAAPTVLIGLANHPSARRQASGRRIRVATGGAPPSPTTIAQMANLGVEITHLYGLTETYGPSLVCEWWPEWNDLSLDEQAQRKSYQGVPPVAVAEVRVVGDEVGDVPADGQTMGEVVIRSNTVMQGYFQDPAATDSAFRGGWFHSGDLGVLHPNGYIELRDRAKDVIISGGENISTVEVEQVLMRHPAVLEVAVVGVPDERWGEVAKAFVTLKPEHDVAAPELIAFCRQYLAAFKSPKSIHFGDLPKTSTGKIQKFVLREQEWAGRARRIN